MKNFFVVCTFLFFSFFHAEAFCFPTVTTTEILANNLSGSSPLFDFLVSPQGVVHAVYDNQSTREIIYTWGMNGSFQSEVIANYSGTLHALKITTNSKFTRLVAYVEDDHLMRARKTITQRNWSVSDKGVIDFKSSLNLSGNSTKQKVLLAYTDSQNIVNYTFGFNNNTPLTITPMDVNHIGPFNHFANGFFTMAYDENGIAHFAAKSDTGYQPGSSRHWYIKYATLDRGQWFSETADNWISDLWDTDYVSFDFTSTGQPTLLYDRVGHLFLNEHPSVHVWHRIDPGLVNSQDTLKHDLFIDSSDNAHVIYERAYGAERSIWHGSDISGLWSEKNFLMGANPLIFDARQGEYHSAKMFDDQNIHILRLNNSATELVHDVIQVQ